MLYQTNQESGLTRRVFLALAVGAARVFAQRPRLEPLDEAGFQKLLASQRGKVALVDFWATWCVPCRAEMPQLVALESRYRARGLSFLTVSCDEPEQEGGAADFLAKVRAPLPAYIKRPKDDDKFINAIDPKWSGQLPALFLYGRQGRKLRAFYGETSAAQIEAALRSAF